MSHFRPQNPSPQNAQPKPGAAFVQYTVNDWQRTLDDKTSPEDFPEFFWPELD
jgi:hypothetical protein